MSISGGPKESYKKKKGTELLYRYMGAEVYLPLAGARKGSRPGNAEEGWVVRRCGVGGGARRLKKGPRKNSTGRKKASGKDSVRVP